MNIKTIYCISIQPQMLKFINYQKAKLPLHPLDIYLMDIILAQRSTKITIVF